MNQNLASSADAGPPIADGRYRLLDKVATGPRGTVYKAFDQTAVEYRTVLVAPATIARHPEASEMFQGGARRIAVVRHPRVARIHDVGLDGERLYLVFEHCPGGTLRERLRRIGPLPVRPAAQVAASVLDALDALHSRDIVLRGHSPENVLVDGAGAVKLADFGAPHAGRPGERAMDSTMTGPTVGVWAFLAPEERRGTPAADPRADIYAMGAFLYAIMTRKLPPDLFMAEVRGEMLDPLAAPLRSIVVRATLFQPERRYTSAREMADALSGVMPELPVPEPNGVSLLTPLPPA